MKILFVLLLTSCSYESLDKFKMPISYCMKGDVTLAKKEIIQKIEETCTCYKRRY